MNKYPIYIPSKGRSTTAHTANALLREDIPFHFVVEPQDATDYEALFGKSRIIVMPEDNMGVAYARNFIKALSKDRGEDFHWQIDDNIRGFCKRSDGKNRGALLNDVLTEAENFVDRHENVGIAGLSHIAWAFKAKTYVSPNKQVYSCVLVRNDVPAQWRKGVVEDTDYSLQVLSLGLCTVLFNTLLIAKEKTMKMSGGNTEIEYSGDGRMNRSLGLQKMWPDAFKITYEYGRPKVKPSRIWSTFKTPLKERNES